MTGPILSIAHAAAPGRVRLKSDDLRGRADLVARASAAPDHHPGILSAVLRPVTGSLVVHFDPAHALDEIVEGVRRALSADPATAAERVASAPACASAGASNTARTERGDRPAPAWHARDIAEIVAELASDVEHGLSSDEALRRLRAHGANVMPREERPSSLSILLRQFRGLPVMMLLGSSVVSLGSRNVADAIATLAVVVGNGVLGFVTEGQAERRIHDLMDTSRTSARVMRDGVERLIAAGELVPGDLLMLAPGHQVPADCRLLSARALSVDESALTGESLPVEKHADLRVDAAAPIGSRPTMLFAGTIVSEGDASALVVATGAATEAARIQLLSATPSRPQAPVEAELERLGSRLATASLVACGVFAGVGLLRGYPLGTILKDALALAVAAVPEGLPVVATSTLSSGLKRMEERGILIRDLAVVESMGALQTICLDKTGTLTQNRMEVVEAVAGLTDVACDDCGALQALAEVAALNNDAGVDDGRGVIASPTEHALLAFAEGLGIDVAGIRAERPRRETVERGIGRPWMTTRHGGEAPLTAVKGAPEALLARSTQVLDGGVVRPLTEDDRAALLAANDRLASRPARVLGFARRDDHDGGDAPDGLTFLGLVAMVDPIRPGAADFIKSLHAAGIETVLITGDQAATAAATARALNLSNGAPLKVIDSANLTEMSQELLAGLAGETHVFARVSSHEKLAIVKALQASGRVVAMTGDGVNDGPALNAANIGIAMGESGTDLARDVANVVIRDDELGTLIEAIAQGRAIYRNIRRSLEFLITTNMSEIAVSIVEALHGPGEIETPMELLWINLTTDVFPGLGLALADPDPDVMEQAPRAPGESIIPGSDLQRMGRDSAVIAASALASHFTGLVRYGPGPQTRGMTFLTLSLAQLLYTLVCQRRDPRQLHPEKLLENKTLDLAILGSSALAVAPFLIGPLRRLLGIAPLSGFDTAVATGAALVPFASVLARRGIAFQIEGKEVD
ncbi:HAD-IC family P-type ATPase [Amorphus sp. 3PC139-8]|uniref:cation-translocating P-type ATPase n=1 Tax=Amorphus sp. 3PC139-8 TaxID=2735676 RepID=UPI00345D29B7